MVLGALLSVVSYLQRRRSLSLSAEAFAFHIYTYSSHVVILAAYFYYGCSPQLIISYGVCSNGFVVHANGRS
jgi:hypothetical protein